MTKLCMKCVIKKNVAQPEYVTAPQSNQLSTGPGYKQWPKIFAFNALSD